MNDKLDIEHIAKLSRLDLSKEEKEKYSKQMGGVLEYAEKIGDFRSPEQSEGSLHVGRDDKEGISRDDTSDVEVGVINGVTDAIREDEVGESLSRQEALKNASTQKDGFIQVKGVFAEDE